MGLQWDRVSNEKADGQAKNSIRTAGGCTGWTPERAWKEGAVGLDRVVFHAGSIVILMYTEGSCIQLGLTGSFVLS